MGIRRGFDNMVDSLKTEGVWGVYGHGFFWESYDEFRGHFIEEFYDIKDRLDARGYHFLNEVMFNKRYVRVRVLNVIDGDEGIDVLLKIEVGYELDALESLSDGFWVSNEKELVDFETVLVDRVWASETESIVAR